MHEIKFRGRDTDRNWHYGDLLRYVRDSYDMIILVGHANSDDLYDDVVCVDYDTVGQYTGLKDCKGQEIFEGDILFVKAKNRYWSKFDSKHVVTWCNDGWILNDYGTDDPGLFHILMNSDCEIIGNAYDNPELIS